jgi:glycosyltransferase involved in cell wall biosynthesis
VVMPAHNEESYLRDAVSTVVAGLRARGDDFEVLVVENGSTDRTAEVAAALAAQFPEVRVLHLGEADYGRALRTGFLAAAGGTVTNFDVDFVDLGFLDAADKLLEREGAAVVVGSKRGPGSEDDRNFARRLVTAVFSIVLHAGFGLQVSDTHGLKLLDRVALGGVVDACEFGGDIFDTELVLRAERRGLRVVELPVNVTDHRPPRTPIVRRIPRSLLGLARLRVCLWRTRGA